VAEVLRDARLVTLVGPAGAGKTRLAVESAASLDDRAEAVPCWVDLGSVERGQVVAAVARALAIPDVAGRAAADSILARLAEARTLLVLDNCEHVLDEAAGLAARVLEHAPATRILATSREALRIAGEVVRDVGGLPGREAARLFAERIPEGAGALAGPGDAAAIECIVARLDGLPLAIELAAAKLRALSVGELAQELGDRLSLLDAGDRSAPRRQRTLRTAIDWSAELISDRDRLVLQRISVFPGSFDAHSAAAVAGAEPLSAGEVLPALARLVEASLLAAERRPAGTRYRLLQTVRAYARERAAAAGELAGAARRHRDAYTAWAEELFRHCNGSGVAAWLPRGREEYPNLLAALRWSLEHGEGDAALQLASALTRFWWRTGLAGAGLRLLDEALELAGHGGPWASRALVYRAMLTRAAGTPDAGAAARDAVAVAARQPDPMLRWTAAFMEVQERLDAGDVPAARAAAGRIGQAASEAGDEEGLLVADQALGAVLLRAGDLDAAAEVLIRARDGMRRLRGTLDAGWILIDLADVRLAQGRTRDALESARLAQGDFRRRGDPRGVAAALVRAGRAHSASGDPDSARKALAEAAAIAERWGYPALRAEAAAAAPAAAVR
jgi:predicted ATPase